MGGMGGLPGGGVFVGRHAEFGLLRDMLVEASTGSARFVLVTGERGIGKSSLLRQFVAGAGHICRLNASGDQSETLLPYGVLEQLARSAEPSLPFDLPALTNPSSSLQQPVAMGTAFLELLRSLQQRHPVVVVVDDAHVADEPSLLALLFAFRRLKGTRVLAVLSASEDSPSSLPEGLTRLMEGDAGATVRLKGLDDREIRELIAGLDLGSLSPSVAKRLSEHTGGNPLHIRALIEELGLDALRCSRSRPWPAPKSVSRGVLDRLGACPPAARRLVAAAAVMGMRSPLAAVQQVAGMEQPLDALQAAVDQGLVDYDKREVAFSGALVRAAVYHGLTLSERAELHTSAATQSDDERAAVLHRAAATTELDEGLAAAVEQFARQEGSGGDWASAAALFEEAALLFPPGEERERNLLEAVECHLVAGDLFAATSLGRDVERFADVARSHYLLGHLAVIQGRHDDAGSFLTRALDACHTEEDPALAAKIAGELATLNAQLLQPTDAIRWAEKAIQVAAGTPLATRPLPYLAYGLAATGKADRALDIVGSSPVPGEDPPGPEMASHLMAATLALLYSGATDRACDEAARLVSVASQSGPLRAHVNGLALLAFIEYRLGAWSDAIGHAELGVSLGSGMACSQSLVHATAAWPRARRGEWETAEAHVARALTAARCPSDMALAKMAEAVVGSARGQHRRVVDAVTTLRGLGAPGAVDEPGGLWPWHEVYIDALIALGLLVDASRELARLEAIAVARSVASLRSIALRLRASLEMARGRKNEADAAFRSAIGEAPEAPEPFTEGLLHLSYGAFLRRCGHRSAAAAELDAARLVFARLGARPFIERCDRELASVGRPTGARRNGRSSELTPREASVARLVSEGKRNREVASELVVSENTVEYHLKNIYAKLGVASRTQLIVRLVTPSEHGHRAPRSGSPAQPCATEAYQPQ